jgi:hypothetical protein
MDEKPLQTVIDTIEYPSLQGGEILCPLFKEYP